MLIAILLASSVCYGGDQPGAMLRVKVAIDQHGFPSIMSVDETALHDPIRSVRNSLDQEFLGDG